MPAIAYPATAAMTRSATVVQVVDGDTVKVDVDLGWHIHLHHALRLYGINAPELGNPGGIQAKAALGTLLPAGTEIVVISWLDRADKYGRILGRIVTGPGLDVNQHMIDTGHAAVLQ